MTYQELTGENLPEKYITFKRTEWDDFLDRLRSWDDPLPTEIPDAVIIRCQDTFAPPALEGYANSITITIEILKSHGEEATAARLLEVADYFQEKAAISWGMHRKLPD